MLRLEGRLDREWAEHLSGTLGGPPPRRCAVAEHRLLPGDLRQLGGHPGPRPLAAGAGRPARRRPAHVAAAGGAGYCWPIAGWDPDADRRRSGAAPIDLRAVSWQLRDDFAASGQYETVRQRSRRDADLSPAGPSPSGSTRTPVWTGATAASSALPARRLRPRPGRDRGSYEECRERLGELVAVPDASPTFPATAPGWRTTSSVAGGTARAPCWRRV